jgi:outer membrane protein OmpA-like peptidoglycan-associated protein
MRNRVLLAAGTLAAFVPTLLLAQQRPAQPPAQPAKPPAQQPTAQPAQRPAAQPAQRPAAQPVQMAPRPMMAGAHREHTWELSVGVGALYIDKKLSPNSQVVPGGAVRIGYNINEMWNISVGTGLGFASSPSITFAQPFAAITWTPNINKTTSPFITVGGGGTYASFTGGHLTAQYGGHVGVGIRHMIGENVALRVEGRVQYENFKESYIGSIPTGAATVGLSWFLGGRKAVASVGVNPRTAMLASVGATQQLSASAMDKGGKTLMGRVVTWTSSNSSVATVSTTGLVTARSNGSATITAASEGMTGTANVTVAQAPATVAVAPATGSLAAIGQTQQFTATAQDANRSAIANPPVTWSSSDATVASVNASGLVTAVKNGTARITAATANGRTAVATVTVSQATASVAVTPATSQISAAGATAQLAAQALDAGGAAIAGKTFTWTSDATGVATVSPTGLATGVANGVAHVTAGVDGKSGSAMVTVVIAPKGAPPVELPALPATNASMVLKNVTFRPNRAVLLPAAMADLDKIAIAIQATPNSKWEIGGYTSSVGTAPRNLRLSQQRAAAVKTYLVSKGVAAASLTSVGYGAQHPVASNKTAAGRAQNMRVEIKRLQ